jgi:RNA polymerase sigma factor for flagellar operon FliA
MNKSSQKPLLPEKDLPRTFRRSQPVVIPQTGYLKYTEDELVEKFTPMVIKWVHRLAYHPSLKQEIEDFRNIGLTALIKAKRNFNPTLGVPFEPYCSRRIRGSILDAIRKKFSGSRTVGAKMRKIEQTIYELTGNLERPPTEAEIADHLNLKINQYRELLDQVQKRVYISFNDQWARVDVDESIEEKLDEKQPDPCVEAGNHDLQDLIRARLANMNPKQQKVIAFYYYEGLRFRDIAEIMEITESRVCQIHTEAVLSLRSFIRRIETTGAKII